MFGKLIKNIFNKAEEAVENIVESTNTQEQSSHQEVQNTNENLESKFAQIQDYLEYSSQIPKIDDNYHVYYHKFFEAIQTRNRSTIESAINNWKNELDKMTDSVKKLGKFNDDESLVIAGTTYFQNKKKNVEDEFTKFAEAVIQNSEDVLELKEKAESKKSSLVEEINAQLEKFRVKYENKGSDLMYTEMMQQHDAAVEADAKDNPLLEPIHGISLFDYAAGMIKIGSGVPSETVLSTLGVEKPQWDEADLIWQQRMQEDPNMTVASKYGQYFAKVDEHPTLGNLSATSTSDSNNSNVEKMKTDEHFFYDLMAERQAAFEVGKDGGQYIQDKYGINLMDFQSQALVWTRSGNYHEMLTYQEDQYKKYLEQFQQETGGTIADDIEF